MPANNRYQYSLTQFNPGITGRFLTAAGPPLPGPLRHVAHLPFAPWRRGIRNDVLSIRLCATGGGWLALFRRVPKSLSYSSALTVASRNKTKAVEPLSVHRTAAILALMEAPSRRFQDSIKGCGELDVAATFRQLFPQPLSR